MHLNEIRKKRRFKRKQAEKKDILSFNVAILCLFLLYFHCMFLVLNQYNQEL